MYPKTISKEEIQGLPLVRFDGEIHVIDSHKKVNGVFRKLESNEFLGFDTEKKPTFIKGQYHPTALVQLSTLHEAFLFRISEIGFHKGLKRLLESDEVKKVGISIRDDIAELNQVSRFLPKGFIELNNVASDIGIRKAGVRNLCAIFLERRVSKNQQTSNWENKVLTSAQANYAATDAWVCAEIYYQLSKKGYIDNGIY